MPDKAKELEKALERYLNTLITEIHFRPGKNIMGLTNEMRAEDCGTTCKEGREMEPDNWRHKEVSMRCGTCMWYVGGGIGRCRRHSPCQAVIGWPVVYVSDWCGDHKLDKA